MSLRIGHQEREAAVESLRVHATDGRLNETELERRIDQAYDSVTQADLNELFEDLPRVHSQGELQLWKRHQRVTFLTQIGIYTPVSFLLVCLASGGFVPLLFPVIVIFAWGAALMNQAIRIHTQPALAQLNARQPLRLGRPTRQTPRLEAGK